MLQKLCKLFVMAALLTPLSALAINNMYQWVDEKGVTHYTQTPPLDKPYKVIKGIDSSPSSSSYRSHSQIQPRATQPAAQPAAPRTEVERYQAARKKNCELARRNLNTLTTVARIRITGDDGEERLLTDEEKVDKIKLSQQQVKNFCSKDPNQPSTRPKDQNASQPY